jgi:hypothetical protein
MPPYGGERRPKPACSTQGDSSWHDSLLFYEYFHGDIGRGVGASHHTGWTGVIAMLLQPQQEVTQ